MEFTKCKLQKKKKRLILQFGAQIKTFKHIKQKLHYWETALGDISIL